MRKAKGLAIIGQLAAVLDEMSRELHEDENASLDKYVGKLEALSRKTKKFNAKNKDARFKPAFEQLEKAVDKFIAFMERNDERQFVEAQSLLDSAVSLMTRGGR